jgi:hypothetical protein
MWPSSLVFELFKKQKYYKICTFLFFTELQNTETDNCGTKKPNRTGPDTCIDQYKPKVVFGSDGLEIVQHSMLGLIFDFPPSEA